MDFLFAAGRRRLVGTGQHLLQPIRPLECACGGDFISPVGNLFNDFGVS
jgi:hypothetical protein